MGIGSWGSHGIFIAPSCSWLSYLHDGKGCNPPPNDPGLSPATPLSRRFLPPSSLAQPLERTLECFPCLSLRLFPIAFSPTTLLSSRCWTVTDEDDKPTEWYCPDLQWSSSVSWTETFPHRHSQRSISWVIPDPAKLSSGLINIERKIELTSNLAEKIVMFFLYTYLKLYRPDWTSRTLQNNFHENSSSLLLSPRLMFKCVWAPLVGLLCFASRNHVKNYVCGL